MSTPTSTTAGLIEALHHLTAAELRERINALESQAAGLRRLLLSVAARERAAARRAALLGEEKGVPHVAT
jgi:hypothetical protein